MTRCYAPTAEVHTTITGERKQPAIQIYEEVLAKATRTIFKHGRWMAQDQRTDILARDWTNPRKLCLA
jgi:hypothetical protein